MAVVLVSVCVPLAADDARRVDRSGSSKRREQLESEEVFVPRHDFDRVYANDDDDARVTNMVLVVSTVTGGYDCYTCKELMSM